MKQKTNITIDDLAIMIKDGFDETDKKFEQVRKDLKEGLQSTEGRLMTAIKGEKERRINFNIKMIEILNRNGLLEKNELDYLELLT